VDNFPILFMLPGYKKVLEIGFGGNPFGISSWHPERKYPFVAEEILALFDRSLPPGVDYFGIDFPSREVQRPGRWVASNNYLTQKIFSAYRAGDISFNITFEEMDARSLRYGDDSFDEVHLHYVLDDPSLSAEDGLRILDEARRVIRPGRPIILSGELFRADMRRMAIENVGDKVLNVIRRANFELPKNQEDLQGVKDCSLVSDLVEGIYQSRRFAINDRAGISHGIYLLVLRG